MKSVSSSVRKHIESFEANTVFSINDFLNYGNYDNVKKILIRLANKGIILRIIDGYYQKAYFNKCYDTYFLSPVSDVVHKIASVNGWDILPSGNEAINMLGLSTQVPAHYEYLSSGPTKILKIYNVEVKMRHTNNKNISNMSQISGMIVNAFNTLGKDYVTSVEINIIKKKIPQEKISEIISETKHVTGWIYEKIKLLGDDKLNKK
jgi:hypothetical protein